MINYTLFHTREVNSSSLPLSPNTKRFPFFFTYLPTTTEKISDFGFAICLVRKLWKFLPTFFLLPFHFICNILDNLYLFIIAYTGWYQDRACDGEEKRESFNWCCDETLRMSFDGRYFYLILLCGKFEKRSRKSTRERHCGGWWDVGLT